ncbi:hypothetical protein J9303_11250 [Bacillaceae bacterium Marseille-Q3522]|nr:hypothetical protein [Bacillaceae bacterium Marseille-Q3522]
MKFDRLGFAELKAELTRLDDTLSEFGLLREEQWDYERVTYDRKFELKEGVYYLRIQGYAFEGDVGAQKAVIQLLTPILGKHYYPHGIEYGEDEFFPEFLITKCEKILHDVKKELDTFALLS